MTDVVTCIAELEKQSGDLRFGGRDYLPPDLQRGYNIELTYTSNAIE